jgi:TolA-binding protein
MVTLEQVKLLEAKVVRAVEYVERISRENSQLQGKLDSYQKRIDELEVLIQQFREDQGKIEEGILAALERLNKFEDAIERSIADSPDSRPGPKTSSRREGKAEKPAPNPPAPIPPEETGPFPGDSEDSELTGSGPDPEPEDPLSGIGQEDGGEEEDFSGGTTGELDIF